MDDIANGPARWRVPRACHHGSAVGDRPCRAEDESKLRTVQPGPTGLCAAARARSGRRTPLALVPGGVNHPKQAIAGEADRVRSCRKEEFVGFAVVGTAGAKIEVPQARDRDRRSIRLLELAKERSCAWVE